MRYLEIQSSEEHRALSDAQVLEKAFRSFLKHFKYKSAVIKRERGYLLKKEMSVVRKNMLHQFVTYYIECGSAPIMIILTCIYLLQITQGMPQHQRNRDSETFLRLYFATARKIDR